MIRVYPSSTWPCSRRGTSGRGSYGDPGRFGVKAGDVFDATGRSIPANMELWPGLLALALALNLLELVMRKWKGLLEALHLAPVEAG